MGYVQEVGSAWLSGRYGRNRRQISKKRLLLICPRIAKVEEPDRSEIDIAGFSSNSAEDEITLQHSQNHAGALKDLHYKKKPRRLWIEAICIDQTKVNKRISEIKKMRLYMEGRRELWFGLAPTMTALL